MNDLNASFWMGLAASIPLSIFANLVTPRVQKLLVKHDEARSTRRAAELRAEYDRVLALTGSPDKLHTHLLQNILFITLISSFFGAISGGLVVFGGLLPNVPQLFKIAQVLAVVGAVAVTRICFDAIRDTNRVREFDRYKARVEAEIGKLD